MKKLPAWPASVHVHALAGQTELHIAQVGWFGIGLPPVVAKVGDMVVPETSAVNGADESRTLTCGMQLNLSNARNDRLGYLVGLVDAQSVTPVPAQDASWACAHGNLMRTAELTVDALGIVADEIASRLPSLEEIAESWEITGAGIGPLTIGSRISDLRSDYPMLPFETVDSEECNSWYRLQISDAVSASFLTNTTGEVWATIADFAWEAPDTRGSPHTPSGARVGMDEASVRLVLPPGAVPLENSSTDPAWTYTDQDRPMYIGVHAGAVNSIAAGIEPFSDWC